MSDLLYDENVLPAVIKLTEGARRLLVLVSPYNDFSVNLSNAVKQAAQRVSVIAVCRSDQDQKEKAHLDWLTGIGAQVHLVERLHSKIYLNEEQAIVTSMNLLKGSAVDSKEIAFLIQDAGTHAEILGYVNKGCSLTQGPTGLRPASLDQAGPLPDRRRSPAPAHLIDRKRMDYLPLPAKPYWACSNGGWRGSRPIASGAGAALTSTRTGRSVRTATKNGPSTKTPTIRNGNAIGAAASTKPPMPDHCAESAIGPPRASLATAHPRRCPAAHATWR